MVKIKAALAAVADRLGVTNVRLKAAQRLLRRQRKRVKHAHDRALYWQKQADRYRAAANTQPNPATSYAMLQAQECDRKAVKASARAEHRHLKAVHLIGLVKQLVQKVNDLDTTKAQLEAELAKLGPTISGNKATGGTRRERLHAVALAAAAACASGKRHNFYSQSGGWNVDHCITGEAYGERSDCSSWVTSVYKSADCPDPNGESFGGGYTGTLVAHGKQVSVSDRKPGDLVLYGSGTAHHVEMYVGPGDKTIGHGSAPVDAGVINLFGDGDYRIFRYI